MAIALPRTEDRIGLILAVLAHGALFGWLLLKPASPALPPVPPSMVVTISDSVGLTSTAPAPAAQPAPDQAPQLGEQAEAAPPVAPPPPKPVMPKPLAPDPIAKVLTSLPKAPAKPAHPSKPAPAAKPAGASRIGQNFLKSVPNTATKGKAHSPPAAAIGPAAKSAIRASIGAKVQGPWNDCSVSGNDVELLRASVSFAIARDGQVTSIELPVVTGQTPNNAPQLSRFSECAVRAIKVAAPFNLPAESYDYWKNYKLNFKKE